MPDNDSFVIDDARHRLKGFRGQLQAQRTWCWAAAAASIEQYYIETVGDYEASRPQCRYVWTQHRRDACRHHRSKEYLKFGDDCQKLGCSTGRAGEEGRLDLALMHKRDARITDRGRFYTSLFEKSQPNPVSYGAIVGELKQKNPVGLRIEQTDGTFHLLVVYGYDPTVPSLIIWDPAYGERIIAYNQIQVRLGTWTHTIYTSTWWDNHKSRVEKYYPKRAA